MEQFPNSLTLYLSAYIEALFDDLASVYTRPHDWLRDKTRLLHEIRHRGSHVLTIMLPSVGKALDQALDQGRYQPLKDYMCSPKRGEVVPVFLRDLFSRVFDPCNGMLRDDPDVSAICALRQIYLGAKKLLLPCEPRRVYDEVKDFYRTELECRRSTLDWDSDIPLDRQDGLSRADARVGFDRFYQTRDDAQVEMFGGRDSDAPSFRHLRTLQRVCDRVFSSLGDFSDEEAFRPRHGTGAVSDLRRGTSKYSFNDWSSTLGNVYPPDLYSTHDFGTSNELGLPGLWRNREVPSKLISVPKTQKSPRLIAAEPSQNQWIQQLLMQQLIARTQRTSLHNCIRFSDQSWNGDMAVFGSINGAVATIDLSSASDRLTCWVVERAARANHSLLVRLHASRTKWVRNAVEDRVFDYMKLRKFSTMGSAVIFPMQSIIYACIAIASVIASEEEHDVSSDSIERVSRRIRVFGDDIIVPIDSYECIRQYLVYLGLKVNESKTFTGRNFRESCGIDAFRGVDVTPTYLRQVVTSARFSDMSSLLRVSNNFWKRLYWKTADWLRSIARKWDFCVPIVGLSVNQPGYVSFCGSNYNHLTKRWSDRYHTESVRVFQVKTQNNRCRGSARQDLMQWFCEKPRPDLPWEAGSDTDRAVKLRLGWLSTYQLDE